MTRALPRGGGTMSRSEIEIRTADGVCPASLFAPEIAEPRPAVIGYMDALGPRPALFALGEGLAAHGYVALLPDLFYRAGAYEPASFDVFKDPERRKRWFDTYVATASLE